ncbi:Sialin like protein [Argiope bruennichi]|uniref:Sialin like protein n=1 Tax=Argiope bruennichi TaxID=94029 RepID=A0A8T0FCJ6_ARGBR|nr:Sialin like protein [Argiope bruennichi]
MGYIPKRCIFTALSFFGIFIIYATRVNMSVAIVAMVNNTNESPLNGSEAVAGCPSLWHNETQDNDKDFKGAKYNWNSEIQGIVLSSFYYGYIMTQLPGGVLCDKVGAKWLFGGGVLITTALYLLVPLAASWGVIAVSCDKNFGRNRRGTYISGFNSCHQQLVPEIRKKPYIFNNCLGNSNWKYHRIAYIWIFEQQ